MSKNESDSFLEEKIKEKVYCLQLYSYEKKSIESKNYIIERIINKDNTECSKCRYVNFYSMNVSVKHINVNDLMIWEYIKLTKTCKKCKDKKVSIIGNEELDSYFDFLEFQTREKRLERKTK